MSSSLATKYRPVTLDGVLGQPAVVASLKRVLKEGKSHAFLFTGPPGVGKTTLARILAAEVAGNGATGANTQEVDAASQSGADAVRDLVQRLHYRAVGASPVKTVILDECHRLSAAAWTVALKPIEEPPKHVYWCLCTTEAGKVPKAIQSRCLKYDLKPVNEDILLDLADTVCQAEALDISDEVLEVVIEGAQGSPRQALVGLELCNGCASAAEARELMRSAGQSKEVRDLCKFLLKRQGRSWTEAVKLVKGLEGQEAESIRISIRNYLASVLLNTKSEKQAVPLLGLLEAFDRPYLQSDRFAPLLMSIGMALGLDQ